MTRIHLPSTHARLCMVMAGWLCLTAGSVQAQEATYRVYPVPVESPLHTTPLPPDDARDLVADPADAAASPFGWHDTNGEPSPEFTTTEGNNAVVYFDANGNGTLDPGERAEGGSMLAFDFPADLEEAPVTYADAIVTNAFYWANVFHDVLYLYGFDEAAGNFQETNYGVDGMGGDPVIVRLDEGGAFNISFSTPPDGASPRMTVTLPPSSGLTYPEFNNATLVHELAHGLSTRLTGTPANSGCLANQEQMGEGWSDWYALMFTQRPEDTRTDPRSPFFFPPAPYSTDFGVNDFTHGDIATVTIPHGVGFVWATILWEMTWDLIDALGFSPNLYDAEGGAGNQLALRLVTEGLKRQPCSPGFVEGRDAILAADEALYDGTHTDLLWSAFARRGLGFSADQGSSNSVTDNIEAFDLPATSSEPEGSVSSVSLQSIAPNPVVGTARVTYRLGVSGPVRLTVYDVRGREVSVLADGTRPAGQHTVRINARDLIAGVYVLRLEADGVVQARPFAVVR